jgi:hypothetical protein
MGVFDLVGTTLSGWLSDRWSNRGLLAWYYGLRGLSLIPAVCLRRFVLWFVVVRSILRARLVIFLREEKPLAEDRIGRNEAKRRQFLLAIHIHKWDQEFRIRFPPAVSRLRT